MTINLETHLQAAYFIFKYCVPFYVSMVYASLLEWLKNSENIGSERDFYKIVTALPDYVKLSFLFKHRSFSIQKHWDLEQQMIHLTPKPPMTEELTVELHVPSIEAALGHCHLLRLTQYWSLLDTHFKLHSSIDFYLTDASNSIPALVST